MKLFLNGGGNTKELALPMSIVNEIMDHNKKILYVPLAMDEIDFSYDDCYKWFQKQVINVDVKGIDMPRSFEQFTSLDFNNYSAIFIGGGNTYKLLKGIKDNGIFEKINDYLNNDGIVIGCSAGAIIFGYDINSCLAMDRNDVNLIDTKGFDKINGKSIFAHYTNSKTEEIHKKYLAVCHGKINNYGEMVDYLKKDDNFNTIVSNSKEGKFSKLTYELISYDKEKDLSLVKVNLETGRHHQIRVGFASRHHPLVGDSRYGIDKEKEIGLFSYELEFVHPVKKELMKFTYIPKDKPFSLFKDVNIL